MYCIAGTVIYQYCFIPTVVPFVSEMFSHNMLHTDYHIVQILALANQSFQSFGEENVGQFTIGNISCFNEFGIWLGKMSVPSEQIFSKAGQLITERRNRCMLTCLYL